MPDSTAPVYSRMTGHWSDCPTYDTLDASDCKCWERPTPRGLDTAANGWEWADVAPGPGARPSWTCAAENLPAARAAGWDDADDGERASAFGTWASDPQGGGA